MKLGFLGTGKITSSIIEGLLKSKTKFNQIIISKRNVKNSRYLKNKSKKIKIYENNQDIINSSKWVFICLTPKVARNELQKLKFRKKHIVVSLVSTISLKNLKKSCSPSKNIFKAGPLPFASSCQSPTIIYPKNKIINNFFKKLGLVVNPKNDKQNDHFWVMTATMASYANFLAELHKYLIKNKVNKINAGEYLYELSAGLNELIKNEKYNFKKVVSELQTKNGINQQLLSALTKKNLYKNLNLQLKKIYKRIKKANDQG